MRLPTLSFVNKNSWSTQLSTLSFDNKNSWSIKTPNFVFWTQNSWSIRLPTLMSDNKSLKEQDSIVCHFQQNSYLFLLRLRLTTSILSFFFFFSGYLLDPKLQPPQAYLAHPFIHIEMSFTLASSLPNI